MEEVGFLAKGRQCSNRNIKSGFFAQGRGRMKLSGCTASEKRFGCVGVEEGQK